MNRGEARPSGRRIDLLAGAGIALAIIVLFVQIRGMLAIQSSALGTDAVAYLAAASALRDGQNPYSQPFQTELLPGEIYLRLPYLYPPLLAVLCIPLTYVPFQTAVSILVWLTFAEACLLCWALSRWIGWPASLAMVFLFLQTWVTVYFGQIGFLIALLQWAALWGIRSGRAEALGAALALGSLLKITPGVGFLMSLRPGWRKSLLAGAAVGLLAIALTLPYAGLDRWLEGSIMALRFQWRVWWLASWTGILTYYLPAPIGSGLSAILGLTALVFTLMRLKKLPAELGLCALLLLPILFARTTWGHHSVTALPVLAILWMRSPGNRLLAAFCWLLLAIFDFRGVAPALTLCWLACVWPDKTHRLEAAAGWLRAWWLGLQRRWSPA